MIYKFKDRKMVYIAGPYAHPDPVQNTNETIGTAEYLLGTGLITPVVPHLTLLWHLVSPHKVDFWYDYDLALLARCDALYRRPGLSTGADNEVIFAQEHDIPVFYDEPSLLDWASNSKEYVKPYNMGNSSDFRYAPDPYEEATAKPLGKPVVRTFETGANRDTDEGKLDYEGFISPFAWHRFGQYMLSCQYLKDGTLRSSDNWQKGIPVSAYMKSLLRHVIELWTQYRTDPASISEETLCATLFNAQGILHETLKERYANDKH
jgi:hypothetical protein